MTPRVSSSRIRMALVVTALLLALLVLVIQLVRWQILEHSKTAQGSVAEASSAVRGPNRGTITDIRGVPLALDTYRWEIWIEPSLVKKGTETDLTNQLAQQLGSSLLVAPESLLAALNEHKKGVITLARQAPAAAGEAIKSWQLAAIGTKSTPLRVYPQGSLASHLLGFVNSEPQAYYGVEEKYDNYLRSLSDSFFASDPQHQAFYTSLPAAWQQTMPSNVAQDLVLTIDRRIQVITEQVLLGAIVTYQAKGGTIIVMNPYTGAIMAMASYPNYDPNRFGKADIETLADPAISKQYEPGSVFKIVTMAAGIDAGLITPESTLNDSPSIEVGDRTIYNSEQRTYGLVTARQALILSLNIPTAEVALQLTESRFYQYVQRFGFGQLTEVDLANEGPGSVKTPGDAIWSRSDLATNAFGQGIAVTPLQMATATCVIANGGVLIKPHIVDSMVFRGRLIHPDTEPVRRVIKTSTAKAVTDMMTSVVADDMGTPAAQVPGYTVAGKTGTAQIATEYGYHPTDTIHSFVGFVPAEKPAFVALIKLDVPRAYAWADGTAAPTFAQLAKQILPLIGVPPQETASLP